MLKRIIKILEQIKQNLIIYIKKWSNKIKRLTTKRNYKIKTLFHILSKNIIQHCLNLKVNTIVIGKNQNFKKMINLGQVNNQNFSLIPYNLFINFVKYKALSKGINFILVEESYTSKTSFIDKEILYSFTYKNKEKPEDYEKLCFLGKRIKRGLFRSKENKLINADVNGAYNIIRKVFENRVYKLVSLDSIVESFQVIHQNIVFKESFKAF